MFRISSADLCRYRRVVLVDVWSSRSATQPSATRLDDGSRSRPSTGLSWCRSFAVGGSPVPRNPGKPPEGLRVTSLATLRKYGLTTEGWLAILRSQGWVCFICGRFPQSGRFVTDHVHVRGWKKMKPVDRRRYVRGVLCSLCNGKIVSKWSHLERVRRAVIYLEAYEAMFNGSNG